MLLFCSLIIKRFVIVGLDKLSADQSQAELKAPIAIVNICLSGFFDGLAKDVPAFNPSIIFGSFRYNYGQSPGTRRALSASYLFDRLACFCRNTFIFEVLFFS